jgi:hypothetical protein
MVENRPEALNWGFKKILPTRVTSIAHLLQGRKFMVVTLVNYFLKEVQGEVAIAFFDCCCLQRRRDILVCWLILGWISSALWLFLSFLPTPT